MYYKIFCLGYLFGFAINSPKTEDSKVVVETEKMEII